MAIVRGCLFALLAMLAACGTKDHEFVVFVPSVFDPVVTVGGRTIAPDAEHRYRFTSPDKEPKVTLSYATPCGRGNVSSSRLDRGEHTTFVEFPREPFYVTMVYFDRAWTGKTIAHLNHTIEERVDKRSSGEPPSRKNVHYEEEVGRQALHVYFGDCERAITIDGRRIPIPKAKNTGGELEVVFVPKDPTACYRLQTVRYGSGNCPGNSTLTFQGEDAYVVPRGRNPKDSVIFWFEKPSNTAYAEGSCTSYRFFNDCPESSVRPTSNPVVTNAIDIDSNDILSRPASEEGVEIKHVLIAWDALDETAYRGTIDPRAKKRSNADAAKLAQEIAAKLRADPSSIDALAKELSEEPPPRSDRILVQPGTKVFAPFKNLALRLKVNEVGIVASTHGYHMMVHVPPPAPDALESTDILARPMAAKKVKFKHVVLGWTDVRTKDPRSARSRVELEQLVTETVRKLNAGTKIETLMKALSEDPGTAAKGTAYEVTTETDMLEPLKRLARRLNVNEVGVVRSSFGIHIVQRAE